MVAHEKPAGQGVHTVLPTRAYDPFAEQAEGGDVVVAQLDPAGHVVQTEAPAVEAYEPVAHVVQAVADPGEKLPVAHALGELEFVAHE